MKFKSTMTGVTEAAADSGDARTAAVQETRAVQPEGKLFKVLLNS